MNSYSEIMSHIARTYFNGRCYISKEKYKKGAGFTIHHLNYTSGDLKWTDFEKGEKGKTEYAKHLLTRIEIDPTRFVLIKKMYHTMIDAFPNHSVRILGLSRLKQNQWDKLKDVVERTERKSKK